MQMLHTQWCLKSGGLNFPDREPTTAYSERAAQLAKYQTGSDELRKVQTDTKGASPMGTLDIKSGSHRLGGLQY